MLNNEISIIAVLSFFTLLPFLIAGGTCFIKFSIVLVMIRNALGIQQVPSSLTLNGIALILTASVMMPVGEHIADYARNNNINFNDSASLELFATEGLSAYREYLVHYSEPGLVRFFDRLQHPHQQEASPLRKEEFSALPLMTLMPAYALSELQSAFKISFYLYVPFVVIDMVVSSILLALGMMMMSPVTISIPVKLILFVAIDGWSLLTQGMVSQYTDLMKI